MDFFSFEAALLRLKGALGLQTDKEVAAALGMDPSAFNKRKARGSFPESEVRALAAQMNFDADYVLTGVAQAAMEFIGAARAGTPLVKVQPEELQLLQDYRACTGPDQEAIRHQAQFMASRKSSPGGEDPSTVDVARRAAAAREQDAKIARALAKAWDKGSGVAATPAKSATAAAAKKGSDPAERARERASRKPV